MKTDEQTSQLFNAEDAPDGAFHFGGGPVRFAESTPDGENTPIEMLARSPDAIDHWYWGRIVHDMSGMRLHKDRLTLDYEHGAPCGFLNKFDASNAGLKVAGELVETGEPGDIVRRLKRLSKGGVPFEASIYFSDQDLVLEWIPEGAYTQVNGKQFEGPGIVAREWSLRGVAVCSYGYDQNTESKFRRESDAARFYDTHKKGIQMKKDNAKLSDAPAADAPAAATTADTSADTSAVPAAPAAAATTEKADEPAPAPAATAELSADRREMARFHKAFGAKGLEYFYEGLSYDDASAKHVAELSAANAKLTSDNAELTKKLSAGAGQDGEKSTVSFDSGDERKKTGFASRIRFK